MVVKALVRTETTDADPAVPPFTRTTPKAAAIAMPASPITTAQRPVQARVCSIVSLGRRILGATGCAIASPLSFTASRIYPEFDCYLVGGCLDEGMLHPTKQCRAGRSCRHASQFDSSNKLWWTNPRLKRPPGLRNRSLVGDLDVEGVALHHYLGG